MKVLVTGGAGYIGTHTCVELLDAGHDVVVVDNFSNSKPEALRRVAEITGKTLTLVEADLLDRPALDQIFRQHTIDAVIHFAGLKAVGESVTIPLRYYHNNLTGTFMLLEAMAEAGCKRLVFSSSATVYGMAETVPLSEDAPLDATNPYGRTKLMLEQVLRDLAAADPEWAIMLLRYFNPVGAHKSGRIGEDPNGIPNNLMPFITQVAIGKRAELAVFGDDYDTPDGTGVRDYIHVVDLAKGHLKALERVVARKGAEAYNLGTGTGYSVLDMVKAFEKASGKKIPYRVTARRPGDIGTSYGNPDKARRELGWEAELGLDRMCADSWRWQSQNPNGY